MLKELYNMWLRLGKKRKQIKATETFFPFMILCKVILTFDLRIKSSIVTIQSDCYSALLSCDTVRLIFMLQNYFEK